MIEIKSWRDGRVLFTAKNATDVRQAVEEARKAGADLRGAYLGGANLGGANLGGANLWDANLRDANLRDANLWDANLRDVDLRDANLRDANLRDANLRDVDLRGAKGLAPERVNDLLLLLDQVGPIRAYKLVDSAYQSPIQSSGKITYRMGETVEAKADTDPDTQCGKGINLATLPWCLKNWQSGYRVLVMEFKKTDIAAIPIGDGKFRVSKCRVVREIPQSQVDEWLGREVSDVS